MIDNSILLNFLAETFLCPECCGTITASNDIQYKIGYAFCISISCLDCEFTKCFCSQRLLKTRIKVQREEEVLI